MMRFMTKAMAYLVAVTCFYLPSSASATQQTPPEMAFDEDTREMIGDARKGDVDLDEDGRERAREAAKADGKKLSAEETLAARQLLKEKNLSIVRWAACVLLASDDPAIANDAVQVEAQVLGGMNFVRQLNPKQHLQSLLTHAYLAGLIAKAGANPRTDQQALVKQLIPLLKKDFEVENGRGNWLLHQALAKCGEPGLAAVLELMLKQVGKRPTWG